MTMIGPQNKEDFLASINSVPVWVKTEEDMFKYAKHLNYRLIQKTALLYLYQQEFKKSPEFEDKFLDISIFFDLLYNYESSFGQSPPAGSGEIYQQYVALVHKMRDSGLMRKEEELVDSKSF